MRYIRVLPIMIITAFGLLSFRVHNIWQSANVEQRFFIENPKEVVALDNTITAKDSKKYLANQHPHHRSIIDFNSARAADADATKTTPAAKGAGAGTTPATTKKADTSKVQSSDPQFMSEEEITVLTKLSSRRHELDKRSAELDRKEKFMSAAEVRLDKKIQEMKHLETSINAKIKEADAKHKKDILSLVKVYEGMKPAEAAAIFADLEPDVLITLVDKMKQKSLALILATMDPVKAREITVELARKKDLVDLD